MLITSASFRRAFFLCCHVASTVMTFHWRPDRVIAFHTRFILGSYSLGSSPDAGCGGPLSFPPANDEDPAAGGTRLRSSQSVSSYLSLRYKTFLHAHSFLYSIANLGDRLVAYKASPPPSIHRFSKASASTGSDSRARTGRVSTYGPSGSLGSQTLSDSLSIGTI